MPDPVKIILVGDASKLLESLKQSGTSLEQFGLQAKKFSDIPMPMTSPETLKNAKEATGHMISFRDAGRLAGTSVSLAFDAAGNSASKMDATLRQGIGTARELAQGLMFGGGVGLAIAAVSAAIGYVISEMEKAKRIAEEAIKPYQDFAKQVNDLGKASSPLAQGLREQIGLSKEQAEGLVKLASENDSVRESLLKYNDVGIAAAAIGVQYAEALKLQEQWQKEVNRGMVGIKPLLEEEKDRVEKLKDALILLSKARRGDSDALKSQMTEANTQALYQSGVMALQKAQTDKYWADLKTGADAAKKSAEDYANAVRQINDAVNSMVSGAVEKAIAPTEAKLGPDTWDEFRKRAEAVKGGTPLSLYGEKFTAVFTDIANRTKRGAAEIAAAFKDFSLFADPKNLMAIDWGALQADVGNQINMLIGKHNVLKEGIARAWAGLSASQKQALREMGMEGKQDLLTMLEGGDKKIVSPLATKEARETMKVAGSDLVKTIKSGAVDKETIKVWNDASQTLLNAMTSFFTAKEAIKQLSDGGVGIVATLAQGILSGQGNLSSVMWKVVDQAVKDAISNLEGKYGGGSGGAAAPASQGKQGANNVTINYNPGVSMATKDEFVRNIQPLVNQAMRR